MATINALPGIKTAITAADTVVVALSPAARNGVQVESQGFTLNTATVLAKGGSSTGQDAIAFTEAKHVAIIENSIIGEISVGGGVSGFVTVIPL